MPLLCTSPITCREEEEEGLVGDSASPSAGQHDVTVAPGVNVRWAPSPRITRTTSPLTTHLFSGKTSQYSAVYTSHPTVR
jgi:hypothetical protein